MIHVESKDSGNKVSISKKGTCGDLIAEWAAVTESLFDDLIENTSVEFAREAMKTAFKKARKVSIKNHEGNEGKIADLFEAMGIGSLDDLLDKVPGLKSAYEKWEAEQED